MSKFLNNGGIIVKHSVQELETLCRNLSNLLEVQSECSDDENRELRFKRAMDIFSLIHSQFRVQIIGVVDIKPLGAYVEVSDSQNFITCFINNDLIQAYLYLI